MNDLIDSPGLADMDLHGVNISRINFKAHMGSKRTPIIWANGFGIWTGTHLLTTMHNLNHFVR